VAWRAASDLRTKVELLGSESGFGVDGGEFIMEDTFEGHFDDGFESRHGFFAPLIGSLADGMGMMNSVQFVEIVFCWG
jgi:hypothetical protein